MACNGYNHGSNCNCGWGGVFYPELQALYASAFEHWGKTESYTVPNAKCPVCQANVFFYAAANGGRVFFDELGPPWPKHPCTDKHSYPVPWPSGNQPTNPRRIPLKKGWWAIPVTKVHRHESNHHVTVMTVGDPKEQKYLFCWDPDGVLMTPGPRLLSPCKDKYGPGLPQYILSALVDQGGPITSEIFSAFNVFEHLTAFRQAQRIQRKQQKQDKQDKLQKQGQRNQEQRTQEQQESDKEVLDGARDPQRTYVDRTLTSVNHAHRNAVTK